MAFAHPTVAVSAPGKVLLAGGYLVLDRNYSGLVFGLSARINIVTRQILTTPGVQLNEIVVESPQFLEAQWRYGYHMTPDGGGIKVTQLHVGPVIGANPFVETTLNYALTYIDRLAGCQANRGIGPSRLTILADNDYYSQSSSSDLSQGRFANFGVALKAANKTGLGSSAALVTSLTASLLSHYLPVGMFDVSSEVGKRTLHNLAQAAHCAAQGKVGSGFDVAAAVYGSCMYKRFSPDILSAIPEAGTPGFADKLVAVVDGKHWDVEVQSDGVIMPSGVTLRMCDVDCGSQTVGMVKKVLSWRARDADRSQKLWDDLQLRNESLAAALQNQDAVARGALSQKVDAVRQLVREMGQLSDVPIEPESQTELLNAVSALEGVYGGVVPGAGGFDALALLVKDDEETKSRIERFLAEWSSRKDSKVKLLAVKGETEGIKLEDVNTYAQWLS